MPLTQREGMSVADNLARIRDIIGSRPVTLIAVTKHAQPQQIIEAFDLGVTEFGENRVQDALARQEKLPPSLVKSSRWHFIGHLQSNKVKQVVGPFAVIHSVDSLKLATEISRVAVERNVVQLILLQVKIADDPSKSGYDAAALDRDLPQILALPGVKVKGLMTIAPLTEDKAVWTRCFGGLKQLRNQLEQKHNVELKELSMGMTADWQEAVSCGATMVRLGRAIFGS